MPVQAAACCIVLTGPWLHGSHIYKMKRKYLLLVLGSLLLSNVFAQNKDQKGIAGAERIIQVDFNKEKGPLNTAFKACVGAGRANEGLRADWQQQLAIARKECGFKIYPDARVAHR